MSNKRWYKGNIHTHTTESDGDESPENVVRWYRRHGYDFLVLSDHNHLTILDYSSGKRHFKTPLMVPGEEVTSNLKAGTLPVHINGIGISRVVEPINADDVVSTIQANVDAILQAGGIASINHPNFKWAFDHTALKHIKGASLLEVFNGHPATNNIGGPGKFSSDEIWDGVLSSGTVIFGVATDDSHNYHDFSLNMSNPGRGWVMVKAAALESHSIVEALATGEFYATTGVTLEDLEVSPECIHVKVQEEQLKHKRDLLYTTRFTGKHGTPLSTSVGVDATYRPRGDEGYIRAVVLSSAGTKAWIQPVFLP